MYILGRERDRRTFTLTRVVAADEKVVVFIECQNAAAAAAVSVV